jgi:hypothetical protein
MKMKRVSIKGHSRRRQSELNRVVRTTQQKKFTDQVQNNHQMEREKVRYGDCMDTFYCGCFSLWNKPTPTVTRNTVNPTPTPSPLLHTSSPLPSSVDYVELSSSTAGENNNLCDSSPLFSLVKNPNFDQNNNNSESQSETEDEVFLTTDDNFDSAFLEEYSSNSAGKQSLLCNAESTSVSVNANWKSFNEDVLFVDFLSGWITAGVPGTAQTSPDIIPCVIGRRRLNSYLTYSNCLYAENAREMRHSLDVTCPIQKGKIENWEDLNAILGNVLLKQMQLTPSHYSLIMAESPSFTLQDRIRLTQTVFETFDVPAFSLVSQATICGYAAGLNDKTFSFFDTISGHYMPVYESYPMKVRTLEIPSVDPLRLKDNNLLSTFLEACVSHCDWSIQRQLMENSVAIGVPEDYAQQRSNGLEVLQVTKIQSNGETSSCSYWEGVSKFSSQACLSDRLILAAEYDECGPSIINRKCF